MSSTNFPSWFLLQEVPLPGLTPEHLHICLEFPDLSEGGTFSQTADKLLEGSNLGILVPPFPLATSIPLFVPVPTQPLPFPQKPAHRSLALGISIPNSLMRSLMLNLRLLSTKGNACRREQLEA